MASEDRPSPSPEARLAIEGLLAGKTLDEVAPQGTSVRGEVEAHLIRSLESAGRAHAEKPPSRRTGAKTAPRTPGSAAKSAAKPAAKSGAKAAAKSAAKSAAHPPAHGASSRGASSHGASSHGGSPHAGRTKAVVAYSDGASRGNP
ncbi:MAG TPA: hypothetical protein VLT84_01915, partial [Acidobacteriota bacterium]|nr:hypothetical protein [Acidobacteriota bacterium]